MGLGKSIADLLNDYEEGLRMEKFGPNYRQEAALKTAQAGQAQAELAQAPLRQKALEQNVEAGGVSLEQARFELERRKKTVETLQALEAAGKLPQGWSADPEVAKWMEGEEDRRLGREKKGLDIQAGQRELEAMPSAEEAQAQRRAQRGVLGAQAEYYRGRGEAAGSQAIGATVTIQDPRTGQAIVVDKRTGQTVGKAPLPAAMAGQQQQEAGVRAMIGDPTKKDSIWNLVSRINQTGGLAGRAVGIGRRGAAALGEDPDVQVYQDQMMGMASRLAKAFGESGRLSDQDIARTVNMFPRVGDSPEVTQRKMERISQLISGLGYDPEENSRLVDAAEQEIGGGAAPSAAGRRILRNKRTGEIKVVQ
jgi:hypothetical protein